MVVCWGKGRRLAGISRWLVVAGMLRRRRLVGQARTLVGQARTPVERCQARRPVGWDKRVVGGLGWWGPWCWWWLRWRLLG
ncbi:hypothetical protein GCM10010522_04420 [Kribbella solani]